jgi:hypothetical protein
MVAILPHRSYTVKKIDPDGEFCCGKWLWDFPHSLRVFSQLFRPTRSSIDQIALDTGYFRLIEAWNEACSSL